MSCSTESNNNLHGKRIGTWMAYQNKANWVGTNKPETLMAVASTTESNSSSQDSTIYLQAPKGVSLTMTYYEDPNGTVIQFIDSTVDHYTPVDNMKVQYPIKYKGHAIGVSPHIPFFNAHTYVPSLKCDSSYANTQDLVFSYFNEDSTLRKHVRLNVQGLFHTQKYLQGCF